MQRLGPTRLSRPRAVVALVAWLSVTGLAVLGCPGGGGGPPQAPTSANLTILIRANTVAGAQCRATIHFVLRQLSSSSPSGSAESIEVNEELLGTSALVGGERFCDWTISRLGLQPGRWELSHFWGGAGVVCVRDLRAGSQAMYVKVGASVCGETGFQG
jgi:hypothetical protein